MDQSIQSHALQFILSRKLNENHLLTYEEDLPMSKTCTKNLKYVNSFILSFVYGFLFCTFFFGIHILVLLVVYLSTDFVLLSFAAI
jgi:hypothetical protein